jgi:hypothetical protein
MGIVLDQMCFVGSAIRCRTLGGALLLRSIMVRRVVRAYARDLHPVSEIKVAGVAVDIVGIYELLISSSNSAE